EQRRGVTPTRAVAELVRSARDRRGWTGQQVAEKCAEAGMPALDRSAVTNIETGRRRRIGVDEWLVLAAVLDVAPLHLLFPRADDDVVAVTPTGSVSAGQARRWATGREPLPDGDERTFRYEVPDSEYERRSQRLRESEQRADQAWRRLRVAQEKLRLVSIEHATLDEGPALLALPGTPERSRGARLDRRLDTAYDEVADAKVASDEAQAELRWVRDEEGVSDGER
ncbi:MAG: helix-turn-helix transcriptional regulator, partial [Nocardioidaceae bacterium]|nr:helix-turn-helix transcriptional regulator [Nocardioidaceae bacterium]